MYILTNLLSNLSDVTQAATEAASSASKGFHISGSDILLILVMVLAALVVGLFFLSRWATNKYDTQQDAVNRMKQSATIYVISKKHDKATNVNLPKVVMDQMPKMGKMMKMYFVQAKIGPQIMTLITDKNVFNAIPVKKNVKVELAGLYIVSIAGLKSPEEMKQIKKEKKEKAKAEAKAAKKAKKTNK